jgi:hypothetical protein
LRSWYIILGLITLTGAAYAVVVTAPLTEDTYVSQASPEMSFSENDTIWAISEGGKPVSEVYLGFKNNFNTTGVISPNSVGSANLKLYALQVQRPGKIAAYFVHEATLSTANWNNKADYDQEANATVRIDNEGEYTLDVTSLIKRAVATCEGGCPFSIVLVPESDASIGFASMESSNMASLEYTAA